MLTLILLRHAKTAREPANRDHERALTDRGRRNAREAGAWLAAQKLLPDLAIVSDAVRTRETFVLMQAASGADIRVALSPQLYHANESQILRVVKSAPLGARRLLICGHNPGISDFLSGIAGSGERKAMERFRHGFPTAAIALLDLDIAAWKDADWRSGRLLQFVPPAILSGTLEDAD